ncbi:MAG: glycerol-3-phosphate 1-O-acyltransferase PlsY [Candidatus Omnitrophica bacterium]|nr:glycerol-3-phosphate 1-O-acyltransferase PlsY [Candidatus Omnitrophota bacterium]
MLYFISAIIFSYIIGAIPTAYIFCRVIKGVDIRTVGSGNVGATNAMRVLGNVWGVTVLFLDVLKGVLPVTFLGNTLGSSLPVEQGELVRIILGLSCICGHNWTIFLGFKGGKGVATTLGVLIGLAIAISGVRLVLGLVIVTWVLVFSIARIVSMASVVSAIAFPFYLFLLKQSNILFYSGVIFSVFIIFRHKSNIKRLIKGEEKRLF